MFELLCHATAHTTKLADINFGGTQVSTDTQASGNLGNDWNYGANFGGHGDVYSTVHHGGAGARAPLSPLSRPRRTCVRAPVPRPGA